MAFNVVLPEFNVTEGIRKNANYQVALNIPAGYIGDIEILHSDFPYINFSFLVQEIASPDIEILDDITTVTYPNTATDYILFFSYDGSVIELLQNDTQEEVRIIFRSAFDSQDYEEELILPVNIQIPPSITPSFLVNNCITGAPKTLTLNLRGGELPYNFKSRRVSETSFSTDIILNDYVYVINDPADDDWEFELITSNNKRAVNDILIQSNDCLDFDLIYDIKNASCADRSVDYGVSCPDCNDGVIFVNTTSGFVKEFRWGIIEDPSDTSNLDTNELQANTIIDNFIGLGVKKWSLINALGGFYKATGVGNFGELVTKTIELPIPNPTIIVFEKVSDVLTDNRRDGQFTYEITGGNVPYNLDWNVQPTDENFSDYEMPETQNQSLFSGEFLNRPISNIVAGLYRLQATDCIGNEIIEEISINEPYPITYFIEEINDACIFNPSDINDMGSLRLRISDGIPPFQIDVFNDNLKHTPYRIESNKLDSPIDIFGLYPYREPYLLTITDANGQKEEYEFEINSPYPLNIDYRIRNINKFGENDGSIEILNSAGDIEGNFNGYKITPFWSGPIKSECDQIPINYNSYFEISITNFSIITELNFTFQPCNYNFRAFGIDNTTLERTLNSISNKIDRLEGFEVEQIGDNLLRIAMNFDSIVLNNECRCTNTEIIINSPGINLFKNTICCDAEEDNPCTIEFIENSLIQRNLCPGTYKIEIETDPEFCNKRLLSYITVKENPLLELNPEKFDETRFEAKDGIIIPNGSGGCGNYLYIYNIIDGGEETFYAESRENVIRNLPPALYNVIVRDECGVEASTEVEILAKPPFIIELNEFTPLIPWGSRDGWIEVSIVSPDDITIYEPYHWLWTGTREYPAPELLYNSRDKNQLYETGRIDNLYAGIYNVVVTNSIGETRVIENIVINQEINPCDPEGDGRVTVEARNIRVNPEEVIFANSYRIDLLFEIHRSTCCAFQNQTIEVEIINDNLILEDVQFPHNRITDKIVAITNNIPLRPFPLDPFPTPQFQDVRIPLLFVGEEPPGRYFIEFNLRGCNGYEATIPFEVAICGADPAFIATRDQQNNIILQYAIPDDEDFVYIPDNLNIDYYSENDSGESLFLAYVPGSTGELLINTVNQTDVYTIRVASFCSIINISNPPIVIPSDPKICLDVSNITFEIENDILYVNWNYPAVNEDTDLSFNELIFNISLNGAQINTKTLAVNDNSTPTRTVVSENISPNELYQVEIINSCKEEGVIGEIIIPEDKICLPILNVFASRDVDPTSMTVSWTLPERIDEYHQEWTGLFVEYKPVDSSNYIPLTSSIESGEINIENLIENVVYNVRIRTTSENGECFSEELEIGPEPRECPEITTWDAVKAGPASIDVSWEFQPLDSSFDIELVNVYYKIKDEEEILRERVEIQNNDTPLGLLLESLTLNEIYEIQLEVVCANCIKNCTTEWKEVDLSIRNCPVVENPDAIWMSETSVEVFWSIPEETEIIDDIDYIKIYVYFEDELNREIELETAPESYFIDELNSFGNYEFQVESYCRCGETSALSERFTPSLMCPELETIQIDKITSRRARVFWQLPEANPERLDTIVQIQISYVQLIDDSEPQTVEIDIVDNLPFETTIDGLGIETEYEFTITSVCDSSFINTYDPIILNTDCPVSCPNVSSWDIERISENEILVTWELMPSFDYQNVEIEYNDEKITTSAFSGSYTISGLDNIDYDVNIQTICQDTLLSCNSPTKISEALECPDILEFAVIEISNTYAIFFLKEEDIDNKAKNITYNSNIGTLSISEMDDGYQIRIDDLSPNTSYNLELTSNCGSRLEYDFTTSDDGECPIPSGLTYTRLQNSIVFNWNEIENISSFNIKIFDELNLIIEESINTNEYTFTRNDISQSFRFEVVTLCASGPSEPEVIIVPEENDCPSAQNIQVLKFDSNELLLDWEISNKENVDSYIVKLIYPTSEYEYTTINTNLNICPPELTDVDIEVITICGDEQNVASYNNLMHSENCPDIKGLEFQRVNGEQIRISWITDSLYVNVDIEYEILNTGEIKYINQTTSNEVIIVLDSNSNIVGTITANCDDGQSQLKFEF